MEGLNFFEAVYETQGVFIYVGLQEKIKIAIFEGNKNRILRVIFSQRSIVWINPFTEKVAVPNDMM